MSGLQALHQFARAHEQHAVAPVDQGVADAGKQVRLAHAGRAEGEQVMPLAQPCIGFGECEGTILPAN